MTVTLSRSPNRWYVDAGNGGPRSAAQQPSAVGITGICAGAMRPFPLWKKRHILLSKPETEGCEW
jgi:hypothetical protein